jgi:hypothetical protein
LVEITVADGDLMAHTTVSVGAELFPAIVDTPGWAVEPQLK